MKDEAANGEMRSRTHWERLLNACHGWGETLIKTVDMANMKEAFEGVKEDCQEVQTKDIGLKWKRSWWNLCVLGHYPNKKQHYLSGKTPYNLSE